MFPCGVPLVNLLMCDNLLGLTGVSDTLDELDRLRREASIEDLGQLRDDLQQAWQRQQDAAQEFRRLFDELQAGVENPTLQMALFLAPGARFHIFRREASLPLHAAPFCYPTEESQNCLRQN